MVYYLVVEPTPLKNILVKLDHETPGFGVKIKNMNETTTQFIIYVYYNPWCFFSLLRCLLFLSVQ